MSVLPKPKRPRLRTTGTALAPASAQFRIRDEQDYAHIDYDTRQFVWKRDGGACCHCAATTNLQFDHIIPRSRGGSGAASNVEVLCRACNSKKRARLIVPN